MNQPILDVGTFGTHILANPSGKFSFVGTVPAELEKTTCETYTDAVDRFVLWFTTLPDAEQAELINKLRGDILRKIA